MFLLSKVVRTNLFIQYCLTFSRNSHKCIYRHFIDSKRECILNKPLDPEKVTNQRLIVISVCEGTMRYLYFSV